MMEKEKLIIEQLLDEYNKYIMSRLINKEYNFKYLRKIVKKFSEETNFIEYSEDQTNRQVAESVSEYINQNMYTKRFEI